MQLRGWLPDSGSGLIIGDFAGGQPWIMKGGGARKAATPGVEKSMLNFEENV